MGVNTGRGSSLKTFFGVYQNELVLQFPDRDELIKKLDGLGVDYVEEDILERKYTKGRKEGQPVYYKTFWSVDGLLTNVSIKDTDWGELLELEIRDVDEVYVISLGEVFQRLAKDFIRKAESIDLTEEVSFGVWGITAEKSDDGKSRSGVRVWQNGEKVEYAIDFDDLPEPTSKKVGKKVKWNFDEQNDFLYNALADYIKANFKPSDSEVKEEESAPSQPAEKPKAKKGKAKAEPVAAEVPEEFNDLPFDDD